MVQVKKTEVREAILKSAFRLFKRRGYVTTTTAQIAAGAKVSESNLYIYFRSKFEILFALCEPWMRRRIERLEQQLAKEPDARCRLQIILSTLWRRMPSEDNGFMNSLMQALATTARREGYRPNLLHWTEERIAALIMDCLPQTRRSELSRGEFAHLLMMAQDGFVLNRHLNPDSICSDETVDLICDLLIGNGSRSSTARSVATRQASKRVETV